MKVYVFDKQSDLEAAHPFAPSIVDTCGPDSEPAQGKVEPEHDDGFANLLGEWARLVPYR